MKSKATPTPLPPFVVAVFKGAYKTVRAEQLRVKRERDRREREKKANIAACKKAWEPVVLVVEAFRRIFYEHNCPAESGLRVDYLSESFAPRLRQGYDSKFHMKRTREATTAAPALYMMDPTGGKAEDCIYFSDVNRKNNGMGTENTADFLPGLQLYIADLLRRMEGLTITKKGVFRGNRKLI